MREKSSVSLCLDVHRYFVGCVSLLVEHFGGCSRDSIGDPLHDSALPGQKGWQAVRNYAAKYSCTHARNTSGTSVDLFADCSVLLCFLPETLLSDFIMVLWYIETANFV